MSTSDLDVAIVGAGAAGLAAAIFTRERNPDSSVTIFEGARQVGAKILVSGGSRCNVTNTVVTAADFNGGRPATVRGVLKAWSVSATVAFFQRIGVPLREEPGGKLFPASNRSRDVLDALLREVTRCGATLRSGTRVQAVTRNGRRFRLTTSEGETTARSVVLTTGGLSLPKTGSDGWGYAAARGLGHSIVPTTPALVPLLLASDEGGSMHRALTGVAQPVRLDVRAGEKVVDRIEGALLWTHFGVSGPAVLDVSRHWLRGRAEGRPTKVTASLCPGENFDSLERSWVGLKRTRPRLTRRAALAHHVPASVATAVLEHLRIGAEETLADLTREDRRRLLAALVAWPLPVVESRGYAYAEVTAGGVNMAEVDPASMESRLCPGLYLAGEILDVDGRLGGFNFQWAWSSAHVAAVAIAARSRAQSD